MAAAPGDVREKPPRGRAAPRTMFPRPVAPAGVPGPAYGGGRRRPASPRPRHVRTIFQAAAEPPHRFEPAAAGTWCDLCCRFVLSQGLRCADCKYTCHAHCRDLVHLGCRRNGKLMDCLAPPDTLDPSYSNSQDWLDWLRADTIHSISIILCGVLTSSFMAMMPGEVTKQYLAPYKCFSDDVYQYQTTYEFLKKLVLLPVPLGSQLRCLIAHLNVEKDGGEKQGIKTPQQDVQKEREPHVYLSKEEIKEKIQSYNSSVTDKLKMTLSANGIYTGFIKVQMELCRPITVQSSQSQGRSTHSNNETAFYLPDGCVNTLHISSTNTVREVIEALLKKFFVADNPAKFALYKRCHKEDQVYTCKLSDREHPLYLRLVAGPRTEMLSFVLREHETGEVMWEAFSIPELQNFLRILDKEENEQLQILKKRYAAYRDKLEEALGGVWKPG